MPTTAELTAIRTRYEEAVAAAEAERTAAVKAALAAGTPQKDLVDATGYTRETLRRIANPEAAEAIREARRTKKEQAA
jgi:hypothetical protein